MDFKVNTRVKEVGSDAIGFVKENMILFFGDMAPEHGTLVSPKMTAGKIGSVITANITAMEEVFQRSSTSQIPI